MKLFKKIVFGVFLLILAIPLVYALSPPSVNIFTGTAKLINYTGEVNTSGLTISAYIDDIQVASTIINQDESYYLNIEGNESYDGKTIYFRINGILADKNETYIHTAGGIRGPIELNLTATDNILPIVTINPITTPTNVSTQTISGSFIEDNLDKIYVNGIEANIVGNSYSCEVSLSEGSNTINITAIDLAKNIRTNSTTIVLDTKKPTVSDNAPTGWQTSKPVFITLVWNDTTPSSGKAWIKYCIDSNNTCIPDIDYDADNKPKISTEGISYLRYQSADNAGNVQDVVSKTIQIDTVPPTISNIKINQTFGIPGIIIAINVTVIDSNSGVSSVKVNVKGPNETTILLNKMGDFYIGIWNFKRWARILFIVLTVFLLLVMPLIGEPIITVPWAYMFENVSSMLSGMLLVLMYTAPIKYYFSKSKPSTPSI